MIGAGAQAVGQLRQRADLLLDLGGAAAPVPGQFFCRPCPGGLAQPRLGDPGERQPAGVTEHGQVPDVLVLLGGRVSQRQAGVAGQCPQQRAGRFPGRDRGRSAVRDGRRLLPPQRVADPAQVHIGGLGAATGALL